MPQVSEFSWFYSILFVLLSFLLIYLSSFSQNSSFSQSLTFRPFNFNVLV